jgi:phosphoglycerate dehydrogenase-like enzyme
MLNRASVDKTSQDTHRPVVLVLARQLDESLKTLSDLADLRACSDIASVRETLPDADVLFVWDYTLLQLLRDQWPLAQRLRWIQVTGVGVDGVAAALKLDQDIVLTNGRGIFEDAVAEYGIALLFAVAKQLPTTLRDQTQQRWDTREIVMLRDREALVLGAGAIGRRVALLLRGLGLRTVVVARHDRMDDELGHIRSISDLDELLPRAEVIVCVLPATPDTVGLLDRAKIERIRQGAMLVNIGRGDLIDEVALASAVTEGRLVGAALDVFNEEPLPVDSPLWTLGPSLIVSPHMAGELSGWQALVGARFAQNFESWRADQPLVGIVDRARVGAAA